MVAFTKALTLKQYVEAGPVLPEHFEVIDLPCPSADALDVGEVLVKLQWLSVDPYMRGRMRDSKGYFVGPFKPGQPLDSRGVAEVIASKAEHLPVGSKVASEGLKWQEVQVLNKDAAAKLKPVETAENVSETVHLGPLGMVGMTAYCSLARIAKPKKGEVAYVSGAAGAVGTLVGQILKNVYGCRVIGSAGSDDKVAFLKRIGYDDAFNYKTTQPTEALARLCPDGIDIYYDNVGGATLEEALEFMNLQGRIVACGAISQYDKAPEDRYGVKNLFLIVTKRLLMQGFIVFDFQDMVPDFERDMAIYVKEGKVTVEEEVVHGLANAGKAFAEMMQGKNVGKMVVKV